MSEHRKVDDDDDTTVDRFRRQAGETQTFELSSGTRKLRIRGSDLLVSIMGMILTAGLALAVYILYQHKLDSADHGHQLIAALSTLTETSKEAVLAQREMNCLIALPQELREKRSEFCKQVTR